MPSNAPLPQKGDNDLHFPRVYKDRQSEKNEGNAIGHRVIDHRGPSSGPRAKRGMAGRITAGAQDVHSPLPNATRIWLKSYLNTT